MRFPSGDVMWRLLPGCLLLDDLAAKGFILREG